MLDLARGMGVWETLGGVAAVAAGGMAYGVRGRSARLFGASVWRGDPRRRAIALTFDDGPSESTPAILELLARREARATFFQCGHNARRLPEIARAVAQAGHEIGNHTQSHARLYFRAPGFMLGEIQAAQETLRHSAGRVPRLFRAPYGARWPGLGGVQRRLGLLGVMWTTLACDHRARADQVYRRLRGGVRNGAIWCLHDGRELQTRPDISATIGALRRLLVELAWEGYEFLTVSEIL
jgi:peptidoglycan/xylan/chitin deacetylase (PgdA/CDA1 family)